MKIKHFQSFLGIWPPRKFEPYLGADQLYLLYENSGGGCELVDWLFSREGFSFEEAFIHLSYFGLVSIDMVVYSY